MIDRPLPPSDDPREALYNDRPTGKASSIQMPAERITTLHGIVFDLDPKLYVAGNALFPPADDPATFYQNIRPVLERHPLARYAEVRISGTGLHLLLYLEPAVELHSAGAQQHWASVVRAVQCTLPIDPDMPSITALTRPVGSTNSKNGRVVTTLKAGSPVALAEVEAYVDRVVKAPFREVALPLLGAEHVSPCPVCGGENTRLDVLDWCGKCYNGCSKVTIGDLYDRIFQPPAQATDAAPRKKKKPEWCEQAHKGPGSSPPMTVPTDKREAGVVN